MAKEPLASEFFSAQVKLLETIRQLDNDVVIRLSQIDNDLSMEDMD